MGLTNLGANADANASIELSEDDKGKILRLALDDAMRKCLPKIDSFLRHQPDKTAAEAPRNNAVTPPPAPVNVVPPTPTPAPIPTPAPTPAPTPVIPAPDAAAGKKFCPDCGTANDLMAKFCSKCGHKLN